MTDLTDFLLARFAEDEATAREAVQMMEDLGEQWASDNITPATPDRRGPHHAGRWSPARVLAECEAKRRIVELMVNEVKDARRRPGWTLPDSGLDEKGRDYRVGFENARAKQLPDALDRTDRVLRLLALPYADHPDYREEWRP